MRAVKEWLGKTDDSRVPPRVRLRIFERAHGVCHLSGRRIRAGEPWHVEHIKPLCLGGEHRETNLAPALIDPHKQKTAGERKVKAKDDRVRKRNLGIRGGGKSKFATNRDGPFKKKISGEVVRR